MPLLLPPLYVRKYNSCVNETERRNRTSKGISFEVRNKKLMISYDVVITP